MLKVYGEDAQFLARPGASQRILLVKIKQVSALRQKGRQEGSTEAEEKLKRDHRAGPPAPGGPMEQGYLLSAKAAAKLGTWPAATSTGRTSPMRLGPHAAQADRVLRGLVPGRQGPPGERRLDPAKQALAGVMRLSPQVGDPAMKARYQELLGQLK